ncbi:MAG TPA: AAA family ATPase [Smithellaceae bacterium]|nr:AAA family ATPase [Smithellaceae bacterium]HQM44765.1 AAA family ATPase [Smithellaceae bacterium]
MIHLPGYQILEEIGKSEKHVLYRGIRKEDAQTVMIKIAGQSAFSFHPATREYEILKNLDIPGVIRIDRLETTSTGNALILKDFGGIPLKKILLTHKLNLQDQLQIAIKLCGIISCIHENQLIHGDINPSSIIINLHTGEIGMTDLSGSPLYGLEERLDAFFLPGTLAYMSPEQTGRMNRMPDYRTDFYSLGVTLYEMFSGTLPFRSDDPVEILYHHIAQTPSSLKSLPGDIPSVISDIVDKLMAKNPEDRYQSDYGIKHDLEKCLALLKEKNRVTQFPIAEKDVSERLNLPRKLYGREREKEAIRKAYDRATEGNSELMLICGNAGTGKTTLVVDTFRSILPPDAFFIEGKFDQIGKEIPYSAILQALKGLIRQMLTKSTDKLFSWKNQFQRALGFNGRVILDVLPEVEHIIGEQPQIPALGPAEAKNVFDYAIQSFFKVLTRQEHPLAMFLDDLQYADPASLRLLEMVLTGEESRHFLLVGAYRENEVGENHPLTLALANIRKANIFTEVYSLGPLGNEEISAMLSDMFSRPPGEFSALASLILKKTGGNAFFINQFIGKIYREHVLIFSAKEGLWRWNLEAIQQMNVTENVTGLLIDRLKTMPDDIRKIMSLASCAGNSFSPSLLSDIMTDPPSTIHRCLQAAIREGLLLPVGGHPKMEGYAESAGVLRFLHDRIQEASYSLLQPEEIRKVHLAIGRAMLKNTRPEAMEERIFEIVSHLLKGMEHVTEEKERLEMARLMLAAGIKAKSSTAYDLACTYLATGMELAAENVWNPDASLSFALHRERSECEYLAGNHDRAQKLFELAFQKAQSNLDRAEIYRIRMALDAKLGRFVEHQTLCIEALKLFGIHLPDLTDREAQEKLISDELKQLDQFLATHKIPELIHLPVITSPEKIACQRLLMDALSSAYVNNPTFFAMGTVTLINITLHNGISKDSNYTFAVWALLLCMKFQQYERAFALGSLALKLNEQFQGTSNRCMVPFIIGNFISHWRQHICRNMDYLREAFQAGVEIGDFVYGSFSAMSITRVALSYGHDSLESVLHDVEISLAFFKRIKNDPAHERQELIRQTLLNLLGRTQSRSSLNSETFNEQTHLEKMQLIKYGTGIALFHLYKAQTLYLSENYAEAMEMAGKARQNILFMSGMMQESDCLFFHSLIITSLYLEASDTDRETYLQDLRKNQEKARFWVNNCTDNFLGRYLLVEAEIARVSGNFTKACGFYDQAIQSAEDQGFIFLAALANELAAKFYLAQGAAKGAGHYVHSALHHYRTWGALRKVSDLEEKYRPFIKIPAKDKTPDTAPSSHQAGGVSSGEKAGLLTEMIDLISIVKSSQAISGEIHFDRLIEKLMKILMENAGAQRGYLFIEHEKTLCISARESSESGMVVEKLQENRLHSSPDYPYSVIQYVLRMGERIVLNDAAEDGLFISDPYISVNRPRSFLCMPIVRQMKTAGILYLENRLLKNAFTPERIKILELLSSQAAISITNSLNYEEIIRTREELQKSKEKLQESLDEYSNLFENIQDVFYRADLDGNLVLVSPSIEKILGYTPEECMKINLFDIYRHPRQRRFLEVYLQQKGSIENFETELRKKDGNYIWVSANSHHLKDQKGNVIGIEGMVRDITVRKQAETLLLDEKERLSVMLRSIGDGVIATNTDGRIILMNKVAEDLTGWTQEDAYGLVLSDVFRIVDEQSHEIRPNPLNFPSSGKAQNQAILVSRSTTEKFIAESAAPIRDKDGKIVGAIIVFRDITEKRKLEMEILKNQKLESIGIFAGGIAHDFNNILTGILGNISLARIYTKTEDKAAGKLAEAEKAVLRATELTKQLLTFSKGGSPVKKTASILELLRESTKFILSGSNIKSQFFLPETVWPVEVDEGQINQVVNNLVLNAIQAMPQGGVITLSACNVHIPPDSPLPLSAGPYVKISIQDEGVGISRENLPRIFDPFFTTKSKGNGLGLATTHSIIRKHDGHIDVESCENQGTTFFIYLPASQKLLVPEKAKNPQEGLGGKGKLLLMDDEDMILEVGNDILTLLGYNVVKAHNGEEAIELYVAAKQSGEPFHAIIMDLTIPGGMGGKEAIQKLKHIDPDVKAIVSSGYSNDPVMADYINQGFSGVIIKPYRIDDLGRMLQKILAPSSSHGNS